MSHDISIPNFVHDAQASLDVLDRRSLFRAAFLRAVPVAWWRVASSKEGLSRRVRSERLREFPFFTPARSVCGALIVDIDRPLAVLEAFGRLPAAQPSWVVATPGGAQAGWLIEDVGYHGSARVSPQRYAADIGLALRAAFEGDCAVDPVHPARIRNPTADDCELFASPNPRVYALGELRVALDKAGLWHTRSKAFRRPRVLAREAVGLSGLIPEGRRNVEVFDACRFAAYRNDDYTAAAWAAFERCAEGGTPFTAAEVAGIIRSVERFMRARGRAARATAASTPMPEPMREVLSDLGRRGGSRRTAAQQKVLQTGRERANTERSRVSARRADAIRERATQGISQREIARELQISTKTVQRALRRPASPPVGVDRLEHQGR